MKILVKYPTRQRPYLFLKNLREYKDKANNLENITWLVSYDSDDNFMTPEVLAEARQIIPDILLVSGTSDSKIHACNRDIELVPDWDILLLISDDMFVQEKNWDYLIDTKMSINFPDTDGCLWFHDGSTQREVCTLTCIGKKYYDRFGYLYHPSYKSFFCDNEYTDIAMKAGKMVFLEKQIAKHEHYAWGGSVQQDYTYIRNEKHWAHDETLYAERKSKNFPV